MWSESMTETRGARALILLMVLLAPGMAHAAKERAPERTEPTGALLNAVVVPQWAAEMRDNLARDLRFNSLVTMRALARDA